MTVESVRGAGTPRAGATDTTMLIWKVIAANPGITRQGIWEHVEHGIPEGYALRRYFVYRETSGSGGRTGGGKSRTPRDPGLLLRAARYYVLRHALRGMCRGGSIVSEIVDGDCRYAVGRELRYLGDPETIDVDGSKAAEHMAMADALRVAEKFLKRGSTRLTLKEREAVEIVIRALRARRLP